MYAIETTNLTKSYGTTRGIIGVNLQVNIGEIFGFIGPNGAGKSTTIRTILNLIHPTSGVAKVFGLDSVSQTKDIKRKIGYLPSEVNYYDNMKVKDLLNYSAKFYPGDFKSRIKVLAERLELDLNRNIDDLSFGNKKKVAIVQALLHQPELLILDEPTSGLDPLMQNRFFETLREENSKGTTIFFSSHILSEVQKMCERVAIIKDGGILKVEDIDELRKTQFKTVKVEFTRADEGLVLPGVISEEKINNLYSILYSGDIKELLAALAKKDLQSILIEEPSLEEIFMHYYQKEAI